MNVSLCNLVNPAIMRRTDITSNNDYSFQLFWNVLLNSKSHVAVSQEHVNFRKELPKCSQSAGCKKNYVLVTAIAKLIPANLKKATW